jgi:hypothetical protein
MCISNIRAQTPTEIRPPCGPMLTNAQMVHAQYSMTAKPKNARPAFDMVEV